MPAFRTRERTKRNRKKRKPKEQHTHTKKKHTRRKRVTAMGETLEFNLILSSAETGRRTTEHSRAKKQKRRAAVNQQERKLIGAPFFLFLLPLPICVWTPGRFFVPGGSFIQRANEAPVPLGRAGYADGRLA